MKKISSLVLALVMVFSVMSISVSAVDSNATTAEYYQGSAESQTFGNTIQPLAETPRILWEFHADYVLSQTYTVNPNKGWALWLTLAPVANSGCTITVYEQTSVLGGFKEVKSYTLNLNQQLKEKVVANCNGRAYRVTITALNGYTQIAGAIHQTEVI